jgi:hypothetical protein
VAAATRHACSPGCGLSAAAWGYRSLPTNILTGTVPTELGTLTALTQLCVHRPLPPRLHVCTVTGLWAERGGGVGSGGYTPAVSRGRYPQSWAPWTR